MTVATISPLFFLYDVDVALDNTNIGKVADFIREQSASKFQCIVISLKEQFYSRAGALTAIFPKPGDCITSYCFTLGLNQFDERENIANRRGELSEKNHLPRLYRLYLPSDMEVDTREFFIELSRIFNCQTEEIDAHSAAAFSYEQYNKDK
ncbi:unnamed protein product [Rotaria magnacalcarata]|uniref:Uncharacterized protein n=2 Tax=Rotaria magnacalcarata TaxID=392030 RepID=A0A820B552_9BILA|nr:unnamed protein product [Rotaria magnacalcarata]